jgi:hypothetical protein
MSKDTFNDKSPRRRYKLDQPLDMAEEVPSNLKNIHSQSQLRKYNDGLKVSYKLEQV